MKNWYSNENFWIDFYPFLFPPESFTTAAQSVPDILKLTGVKRGRILDLCCGPGRFCLPLARRHFQVSALDSSQFLLNKAIAAGEKEELGIFFIKDDMRQFVDPHKFDLILNMFTSFGYFDAHSDNLLVLQNIYNSLKPGGNCLIDIMGREVLQRIYRDKNVTDLAEGGQLIQYPKIRNNWQQVENKWQITNAGVTRTHVFSHWLYSAAQLSEMLKTVGFIKIDVFGSLSAAPYNETAERLIVQAVK